MSSRSLEDAAKADTLGVMLPDESLTDERACIEDSEIASSAYKRSRRYIPFWVKLIIGMIVIVLVLVVLALVRQNLEERSDAQIAEDGTWAEMVSQDDPALQQVLQRYSDEELCLACAADITDDGFTDLIVITRDGDKAYTTPVIADSETSWHELERTLAPYQNQKIRFLDIDKDGVNETLITGDRDGNVGYAVYRISSEGEFVDVFGENMEDCC